MRTQILLFFTGLFILVYFFSSASLASETASVDSQFIPKWAVARHAKHMVAIKYHSRKDRHLSVVHSTKMKNKSNGLHHHISFIARNLPLSILMKRLLCHTHFKVIYGSAVRLSRLINLDYEGSLHGALNRVAAQTKYHYYIEKDRLLWSAFLRSHS